MDSEDSDSEGSDSDGFWEQIRTEGTHRSLVDVYADDLSHAVTSLYKLSLSLQNQHSVIGRLKPPTISTQWTQDTTVSTIHQNIEVASDSGRTKFSAAASTMGDQDQNVNVVPPPPSASSVTRRDPFIRPYCHQTVQAENDEDWVSNVYSDLRPYISTRSGKSVEIIHIGATMSTLYQASNVELGSVSTTSSSTSAATRPFRSRGEADDEDLAAREQESNESQKATVMGVEEREPIYSISVDDEASMSESSISGLLSPTDDRLLDATPQ
ncbi:Tetratricopeptide-like helical [Penicillium subrubescens]|nr:Tetratricopeptide-like helical [Penicillium subrubescens]KAJ5900898.1 Tetratricopeptide-like helical [Penicillium subrubescens]